MAYLAYPHVLIDIVTFYFRLYPSIKEMSFSRYHFKTYLENQNKDKSLVLQYHDVSQSWSVIFQILLKANVSRNYNSFLNRVNNSLISVYKKETDALEALKEGWRVDS